MSILQINYNKSIRSHIRYHTLNIFNYISIELHLVYDWINCFSLLLNSFIDDEFFIFNGILFQISIILFLVENLP